MAVWRLGVTIYMRRCARRIAEMAPPEATFAVGVAVSSGPPGQRSASRAPARGIAITPPHHFTTSRRTLTRGPARSLAMPKHEDVRERTNLVHLLGEDIDELQPSDPMHASLDRKHSQGD